MLSYFFLDSLSGLRAPHGGFEEAKEAKPAAEAPDEKAKPAAEAPDEEAKPATEAPVEELGVRAPTSRQSRNHGYELD